MNLVIGNTSQQSRFYPTDYTNVSSRNFDFKILENEIDSIYIPFAEQRIYDVDVNYKKVNYDLTLDIINKALPNSKKIVVFGSCELWGKLNGTIKKDTQFFFDETGYTLSKQLLINKIKENRILDDSWNKVKIVHPFYFNSSWRSKYFLFGKIFDSIIEETPIEVGNLDFYRDMVHTSFLVNRVIETDTDLLVGAGRLFNVKDFIYELYYSLNLYPDKLIKMNKNLKVNEKFIRPEVEWNYSYQNLIEDTIKDISHRKSQI